ncbi:MAG: PEP-CTERM sorting domain-containing protein [Rhizobiales bacterium]|nr:PEP-CTERM sorting domain-containing protein [Rhizobacter sp.]
MLKHALMATAMAFAATSAQAQTVLINEGFDSVAGLAGSGWVQTNLSSPIGSSNWFQGNTGVFSAQSGAAASYIGANFESAAAGGTLANWLITPTFSTELAGTVSFWANAAIDLPFADTIAFGMSTGSSSTGAFTLGSPVTLTGGWTQYDFAYAAQGAGSLGRFAIAYTGLADNANYIGIDTFSVTTAPIPEPSTYGLMALGIAALAIVRRRRSPKQPAAPSARRHGIAALAVAAGVMSPLASAGEASPALRVVKDPVSGELRAPTAEESAVLEGADAGKALRRAPPRGLITGKISPPPIRHADGTVEQELDESTMSYTVMTRNADGSTSMVCVTGNEAAEAALKGKKKSATKLAKSSKEHTHGNK